MTMYIILLLCLVSSALAVVTVQRDHMIYPCRTAELARANRKFTLNLFQQLTNSNPGQNVLVSPIVVGMGLSMIMQGARGVTEKELKEVLHYGEDLIGEPGTSCIYKKYNHPTNPEMITATRLFGEKTEHFTRDFIIKTSNFANNKIELVDFANQPNQARNLINNWVSTMTNQRINELFPSGSLDAQTKLALAATIYFKGFWKEPFTETYEWKFNITNSASVNVEFMSKRMLAKHLFDPKIGAQILELPYISEKGGPQMSMILIANPDGFYLSEIEKKLTHKNVYDAVKRLHEKKPSKVEVTLPIFELKEDYDLKDSLRAMRLRHLFEGGLTDLSGMNRKNNLFVSSAIHKTFLSVNQNGTEAAAATGFSITPLILWPQLVINKPFHLLLWEQRTENIMFIGRVVNPAG